jgi:AcrR family transcriptional regulator
MRKDKIGGSKARQKILDAALRLFAAKGFAATSVRDITDATSYTQPVLYYHFQSKAALYETLVQQAYAECRQRMEDAALRSSKIDEQLTAALEAVLTFVRDRRDLTRLAFATAFAASEEVPAGIRRISRNHGNLEFVRSLIERAQKAGKLNSGFNSLELAKGIYGALSYQVMASLLWEDEVPGRRQAERMVRLFLEGASSRRGRR